MFDQYGQPIPDDLVILPAYELLDAEAIAQVADTPWYECGTILLVSARAIDYISEDSPEDAGIEVISANDSIQRVDDCLKRHNPIDGFYHA